MSEVLTLAEVAELLKCSEATIRRLDIPYRLAGGRRYSRAAVLAWLEKGHRPGKEDTIRPFIGKRRVA
jgi:hypothetical protein